MRSASAILSGSRSHISTNSSARMRWTSFFAGIGWKQLARRNGGRGTAEVEGRVSSSECRAAGRGESTLAMTVDLYLHMGVMERMYECAPTPLQEQQVCALQRLLRVISSRWKCVRCWARRV